ncbi:MAG: SufD family Fe-S cluster assembly protein [bacterium]|nr:SufD family Fe-S cluster assembly protein [bacterium]
MKNISVTLRENQEKILPLVWTGGSGEINVDAKLVGRGAKLNLIGAFFLADKDQVKLNVNIDHIAPDTSSDTLIKSVLTDRAVGSFYGLVSIKKGAKNTDTFFREDALLLSDTAKAEAIPSLEIDENEVKAGHASTVGPVDEEQLFYLMSRGITLEEAKRLVVRGFLSPALEKIPEKQKAPLEKILEKGL